MTVNDVSKINGMKKNTEESASNDDEKKYVYETNDAKIILYAGADREKNADFARKILKEYGNVVLVFRGHSLVDNIPYNVFGNAATSEFCIFGNCGSDGSKSKYKSSNPDTDLRVVGNTSTGYGGTTNAMVRELLNTHEKREIREITDASVKRANENANRNQDASTVESWTDGDALLDYVYGTVTAPQAKK
jgi:hypothetical protein